MNECVDGEYQAFKAKGGAYVRKEFFGRYPETAALVEDMTDEQIGKSAARRARSAEGLQRLQGGRGAQGRTDGDSGQDRQGLWHGRCRRSAQLHPSAEEDEREGDRVFPQRVSRFRFRKRPRANGGILSSAGCRAPRWPTCMSGGACWAAICPRASRRPRRPGAVGRIIIDEFRAGSKEPHPSTHHGVRQAAGQADEASGNRQAHRADRSG